MNHRIKWSFVTSEKLNQCREQPVSYVKARTTVYYLRARYVSESSLQCCVSCVGGSESLQWLGVTVVPMFLFAWIGNCEWLREHLTSAALPGDEHSARCSWTQPKGAVDMIRGLAEHSPSGRNPPRRWLSPRRQLQENRGGGKRDKINLEKKKKRELFLTFVKYIGAVTRPNYTQIIPSPPKR